VQHLADPRQHRVAAMLGGRRRHSNRSAGAHIRNLRAISSVKQASVLARTRGSAVGSARSFPATNSSPQPTQGAVISFLGRKPPKYQSQIGSPRLSAKGHTQARYVNGRGQQGGSQYNVQDGGQNDLTSHHTPSFRLRPLDDTNFLSRGIRRPPMLQKIIRYP
jgi:hypothetical protein